MRRAIAIAVIALGVVFSSVLVSAADVQDTALVGSWHHEKLQQLADGKLVHTRAGDGSTLQFRADGTWHLVTPRSKSSGTYRWLDAGAIETTIIESQVPGQKGWVSVKHIQVEPKLLRLITIYDEQGMKAFEPDAEGRRPREMIAVSTFARVDDK